MGIFSLLFEKQETREEFMGGIPQHSKVIGDLRYDTSTALLLCYRTYNFGGGLEGGGNSFFYHAYYKTNKGKYFSYKYNKSIKDIYECSKEDALKFYQNYSGVQCTGLDTFGIMEIKEA